jgi:hypothetical protein
MHFLFYCCLMQLVPSYGSASSCQFQLTQMLISADNATDRRFPTAAAAMCPVDIHAHPKPRLFNGVRWI